MKQKQSIKEVLSVIVRISKIGSWAFLVSIIGASLASLANFGLSFLLGKITQVSIEQATLGVFELKTLLIITGAFICMFPLLIAGQTGNLVGGLRAEKRLKKIMIHHILCQREVEIRDSHTGDMMTLLTSDADTVNNYYFQGFNYMFIHPTVAGLAALITTFVVDYRFGLIAVAIGVVSVWVSTRYSDAIQMHYVNARDHQNEATNHVSDILSNETMIRLFNVQDKVVSEYDGYNQSYADEVIEAEQRKHRVTMLNDGFSAVGKILFLCLGIYLSMNTEFKFAQVMLLLPLQESISYMFGNFGVAWNFLLEVATSANRITAMLDTELEDQREGLPALQTQNGDTKIAFNDVTFGYQKEQNILKTVSFTLPRFTTTAFVGESGSGKSTLFQLLLGFYQTEQGSISIDGQNIDHYNLMSLRKQIAYVQQEAPLFNRSIKENIGLGASKSVTDEDIIAAAKKAAIHDYIMTLPDGYDTHVGEQGNQISGGQRQRIAIARALISDAPILILDEPTSALDSESEALIQRALENIRNEKTVLIAAHRLSTIRDADKIIVLDHGMIAETGTHESLVNGQNVYARFVQAQQQ